MAKGSRDLILRDRLQVTLDGSGDAALVYGRVDLSDFVNVVKREGMAIKEIRYQLRNPSAPNGVLAPMLQNTVIGAGSAYTASIKLFATTTAYENIEDVGIASPDVISILEQTTSLIADGTGLGAGALQNSWLHFGTPDLHPQGYNVVSDLLIGIGAQNCGAIAGATLEIDLMVIGEPVKLNEADMTEMLTQQQDL